MLQKTGTGSRVPIAMLASIGFFLALSTALALNEGVISKRYLHDLYYLADAMWRGSQGHIPHRDFHTSIGQAFYWPYWLLSRFGDLTLLSMFHANILVGAALLLLILLTLPQRLAPPLLLVAAAMVVAMAMSGRSVDDLGFRVYDHVAPYNRWGWAFASLLAMIVATRPTPDPSFLRRCIDAFAIAMCLAATLYLKVSFFFPAVGIFVLAAFLKTLEIKTAAYAAFCLAASVFVIELSSGTGLLYLADLRAALAANAEEGYPLRLGQLLRATVLGAIYWSLAILVVLASTAGEPLRNRTRQWWRPLLMLTGIIAASAVMAVQTHPIWELELLGAAMIVLLEYVRRHGRASGASDEGLGRAAARRARLAGMRSLLIAAAFLLVLIQPLRDSAAIMAHTAEAALASECKREELVGTPMEHLLFPRDYLFSASGLRRLINSPRTRSDLCAGERITFGGDAFEAGEATRLLAIAQALRAQADGNDVVLALDFANPYPFILRNPPPLGALLWLHRGRSYSASVHPDPASLLKGVDLVVQTNYPVAGELQARNSGLGRDGFTPSAKDSDGVSFGQDAWEIFGPEVRRTFVVAEEGPQFRIWRRAQQ